MRPFIMALGMVGVCSLFAFAPLACDGGGSGGTGGSSSNSGSGGGTGGAGGSNGGNPCDPAPSCTLGHACLSFTDNTNVAKPGLRLTQLTVSTPASLAELINLSPPECDLSKLGMAHWLLQLDLAANKLRMGVARPVADPLMGFSFMNEGGVSPADIDIQIDPMGAFSAVTSPDFVAIPIFLDAQAVQYVALPFRKLRPVSGVLSGDHNCIGSYNSAGLDPANNCKPDDAHPAFIDGATLDGFVSIEDADAVSVPSLAQSLCVLLSGDPTMYGDGTPAGKCKRTNGVIDFKGDWCLATDSPGGCQDAVRFQASFAASAVIINP